MSNHVENLKQQCIKTVDHFKKELLRLRTGRATTGLLEGINVEYYGSHVPLQQLGMISAPEPRLLTIQVYDTGAIESIEKAIQQSELGLNPARDGGLIRVPVPALTEERRKEYIKKVHKIAEENKVVLRNHRRDAVEAVKKQVKSKEVSEDESRRTQDEIQKVTDKYVAEIEAAVTVKEKEIMEV